MIDGPFLGRDALAAGLITRARLYGPHFRRVFPGVYLPAGHDLDLATRSRAAYLLVRDPGGVLAGYSAALLLGADCARRNAPAEVLVPHRLTRYPGLRVHYGDPGEEVVRAGGCRVTDPERTAWDLARRLPLTEAVVAVDAIARKTKLDPARLSVRRRTRPGVRHCRRIDRVVALADPRSGSPGESRLRCTLALGGLPLPAVQHTILDEYGFPLACADLAYPEVKLALEYDGDVHFTERMGRRDRQRDNTLAEYGWLTMRLTTDDLEARPRTVQRVEHQLRIRGFRRAG